MKTRGFCIFEYDENDETYVTFVYPSVDKELKSVIQETAHFMVTSSNTLSLFSAFKDDWLYFEGKRSTDRTNSVRLYGICLLASEFHPSLYSAFAQILCSRAADCASPPTVLRDYLKGISEGELTFNNLEFSAEQFGDDCFENCSFDILLDRAGQSIPVIWQALVTGRSIAVYSSDISILQSCAPPLLALCKPGKRILLPLVMEKSLAQTAAASAATAPIWCSSDQSVLNGRFDIIIDLSTRSVKLSPSFTKEAGKSSLSESLMNAVNEATASEGDVIASVEDFNKQILSILMQVKQRLGNLSAQSILSLNMAPDKKNLLIAIASGGTFAL